MEEDLSLVSKLVEGSSDAWDVFLERFTRLIYKVFYTRSFGFTREDIEELFNDFLLSLLQDNYRKIRLYEGRNSCSFASYLKKIAINMAIDRRKKMLRRRMISIHLSLDGSRDNEGRELLDLLDSGEGVPERTLMNDEEGKRYLQALYQLPPTRLIVVLLIVYHDYDREEMAELLKTTRQNIDVIFNRSKEQLSKLLHPPKEKRQEDIAFRESWNETILKFREQILLVDRYVMLERCINKLSVPHELIIGLVFIDSIALDPRPERLSLFLKSAEKKTQGVVEKVLRKIISGGILSKASS